MLATISENKDERTPEEQMSQEKYIKLTGELMYALEKQNFSSEIDNLHLYT